MTLSEACDRLEGSFEYNTDLFDRETVEGFADDLPRRAGGRAADPSSRIDALAAVAAPEQARSLDALAGAPAAGTICLSPRDLRAAGRTDSRRTGPRRTLGRAHLRRGRRRANRLANHLRAMGAAPDDRVAVVLERSAARADRLLAILEAGAGVRAFRPCGARREVALLVEDPARRSSSPNEASVEALRGTGGSLVALDRDEPTIASASAAPPRVTVRPEKPRPASSSTSGSSEAEGVGVEHRQITS